MFSQLGSRLSHIPTKLAGSCRSAIAFSYSQSIRAHETYPAFQLRELSTIPPEVKTKGSYGRRMYPIADNQGEKDKYPDDREFVDMKAED